MPLRNKYPITDWVLSKDCVEIGDTVAFFDEETQQEVQAKVISFPSTEHRQYLEVQRPDTHFVEIINFYNTITYKISSKSKTTNCTCGAKHTSNPKFHLPYCDAGNQ